MRTVPKIKGLFIGCGAAGGDWLRMFLKEPDTEVAGIVRPSKAFVAKYGLPPGAPVFPDYQTALAQARAEAAFIASPNCLHREHFLACAERGLHVFIEKPVALSLEDAIAMQQAAERARIKVYTPWGAERHFFLRETIEKFRAGRFGRLMQIHGVLTGGNGFFSDVGKKVHYATLRPETGGGMLIHHTSHLIDWAMQIGGPVASVYCQTDTSFPNPQPRQMEAVAAILRFRDGGTATLLENQLAHRYMHWDVIGDRAGQFIAWHPEARDTDPCLTEEHAVGERIERRTLLFDDFCRIVDAQPSPVRRLLDLIRQDAVSPSGLERAVVNLRVCEALHESARTGRVVEL